MKIYHYTDPKNWPGIKEGSYRSDDTPGLGATGRLGKTSQAARDVTGVFALLQPEPKEWVENIYFKDVWRRLREKTGVLLLDIDTHPDEEDIYVVEGSHIVSSWYSDNKNIPQKYLHGDRNAAEMAYLASKVPLKDFLQQKDELAYILPEIIVTKDIPLEKIHISETQPYMIQKLEEGALPQAIKQLLTFIEEEPSLELWRQTNSAILNEARHNLSLKNQLEGRPQRLV